MFGHPTRGMRQELPLVQLAVAPPSQLPMQHALHCCSHDDHTHLVLLQFCHACRKMVAGLVLMWTAARPPFRQHFSAVGQQAAAKTHS